MTQQTTTSNHFRFLSPADTADDLLGDIRDALLDAQHNISGTPIKTIDLVLSTAKTPDLAALEPGLRQLGLPYRILWCSEPDTDHHLIHLASTGAHLRRSAMSTSTRPILKTLRTLVFGNPDPERELVSEAVGRIIDEPNLFTPEIRETMRTPIDGFREALTTATTRLISDVVAPVHADAGLGYQIRAVRIVLPEYADDLRVALIKLPAEGLNRLARARMEKATRADLLVLDEFYGVTIDAPETLLDGQPVEVLSSWSGQALKLRFVFDGDYTILPSTQPQSDPQGDVPPSRPEAQDRPGHTPTRVHTQPAVEGHTPIKIGTTPMALPIARVVAISYEKDGKGREQMQDIFERDLPLAIGYKPTQGGEYVKGMKIEFTSYNDQDRPWVSEQHLILNGWDRTTGEFQIINRGRNGTWIAGTLMGKRQLCRPDANMRFSLGGQGVAGCAELRIEPVA